MVDIKSSILYFLLKYPAKDKLSISWIMMLMYLSDWLSCIKNDVQLYNLVWSVGRYGPYTECIKSSIDEAPDIFTIIGKSNVYDHRRYNIIATPKGYDFHFDFEKDVLLIYSHVIQHTKGFRWADMFGLVHSTFPFVNYANTDTLDILVQAREYRARLSRQFNSPGCPANC